MNLIEIAYTKIKYIIRKFPRIKRLPFFTGEHKRKTSPRNSGGSMLNQSKEVLCICVPFKKFRDSIKGEPETKFYDMFLS